MFYCEGGLDDNGKQQYTVQTTKDKDIPAARCSFNGLDPVVDVTVDSAGDLEAQGLGGLIAWEQEQLAPPKKGGTAKSAPAKRK